MNIINISKRNFSLLTSKDKINAYYDQTYHQYRSVWGLDKHQGIHYGYWDKGVYSLSRAVLRMNEVLFEKASFNLNSTILDMGCGVGGSSLYLASMGHKVTGISINQKQIDIATKSAQQSKLRNQLNFTCGDYLNSNLESGRFEGIWALETICHCSHKDDFITEAFRLLKPGGRLILAEYFANNKTDNEKQSMKDWLSKWAIPDLDTKAQFLEKLKNCGFRLLYSEDVSDKVYLSSLLMFLASFPGALSTEYGHLFKDYGSYSYSHYKSAFWQYVAFKKYWRYHIILVEKPI